MRPLVVAFVLAWAAGCHQPRCGLERCDIRKAECQKRTAEATACLMGLPPVTVPTRVVSAQAFIDEATATPPKPEDDLAFRRWNQGLSLFGLAPAELGLTDGNRASAAQTGAIYTNKDVGVTVVDHGRPSDAIEMVTLLVHEYAHALQDQSFGIGSFYDRFAGDTDGALGAGSIVEGEASHVEDLAALALFDTGVGEVEWAEVFGRWQGRGRARALASTAPVLLSWAYFRYPFGTEWINGAWRAGGWPGVAAVRAAAPTTTREVLAGRGAPVPSGGWREGLDADAVPALPPRFAFLGADRYGAWTFELFLERLDRGMPSAPLPARLTGDVYSWFHDGMSDAVVVAWRLRFSDEATAVEARTRLERLPKPQPWRLQGLGRDVIVFAATKPESLAAVPETLTWRTVVEASMPIPPPMPRPLVGCARP